MTSGLGGDVFKAEFAVVFVVVLFITVDAAAVVVATPTPRLCSSTKTPIALSLTPISGKIVTSIKSKMNITR